jgi:protein-S-isoprenylcysteine O-methyltransferase Ste14
METVIEVAFISVILFLLIKGVVVATVEKKNKFSKALEAIGRDIHVLLLLGILSAMVDVDWGSVYSIICGIVGATLCVILTLIYFVSESRRADTNSTLL